MNYEVAIVIPTLNEERFISRCLNSIIKQTYEFEKMDVKSHQNIRFIENKKKIQSVAFNIGIKKSTAPYIIRLDAHAEYDSEYIYLCIKNLKDDKKRGNVGGRCNILPFNQSIWAQTNAILNHSRFGIGGAAFRVSNEAHNTDSVPFGAFPRKIIEKIGGMREDLPRGEDNEYNSRIRKAGYKIFFDPNIISSYFARPTLGASCKQMYANGNSIGYLCYIDREAIGIRHLVPLLFVVSGLFSIIISVLWSPFCYVFCGGLALYLIADAMASIMGAKDNVKCTLPLFILFFCVHVSYGMGTIAGLIKGLKTKG